MKDAEIELKDLQNGQQLSQPLIEKQVEIVKEPSFLDKISNSIKNIFKGEQISKEQRIIYFDGQVHPINKMENIVRNQKYSVVSFVPVVLYNQFKFFFNLFFLIVALSQFFPPLQVGFLFTYVAPLVFVLSLTMIKEAYDDYQRFLRDKEANSQVYVVGACDVKSCDLKVGMIVEIKANQRIPADLLLLHTSDPTGSVFIRTDQLDGETDWKLRKAVRFTQEKAKNQSLYGLQASVTASQPIQDIYEFIGLFKVETNKGDSPREALSLENTMWANTVLASGKAIGLVMYTGKETRIEMNSREPRSKIGKLDQELNSISKLLFIYMVLSSLLLVFLSGFGNNWFVQFFRQLLLLSSIIPISLRVNLDFSKLVFSYKINNDPDIDGTVARNSTIPEELGRIQYLLTDKTGTLTQNDMVFKKLSLEHVQFSEEKLQELQDIINIECDKHAGPLKDVQERYKNDETLIKNPKGKRKIFRRDKNAIVRDLVTALCLCHNVTPVYEDGQKMYQASSPDEVALVKIAESLSMKLIYRDQTKIQIQNAKGIQENYEILANFPFSSTTKRMGIIVRHIETDRLIFYLKGADTIMKSKVPEVQRGFLLDECETLALEGLRTLVISQKYLLEKDYQEWKKLYEEANNKMVNREAEVNKVVEQLETDMELLGITGVEDKLQEDVCVTLESLRNAGINVWMLTGDKIETATCIAISAGIKSMSQKLFVIKETKDPVLLANELNKFNNMMNTVLIIDGISLETAILHKNRLFFETATNAPAVVCCRCSPTQKAEITEYIKFYTGKKTLCIGDGGNDVGMIQAGDVGVGIVGKEGKQAALAADYSILKFKYINKLLLWHGRLAYKRSAVMSQFVIHRGLIISIIQLVFTCVFYYVAIPVYNGWLMLGYTTIYTMFPVFCLIFDEDVNVKVALQYPPLYKSLQKGRELNNKTFLIWVWKSIYQGGLIMLLSLYLFENSFLTIVTITFTSLIVSELLNIYSEVTKLHPMMMLSQLCTLILYFISLILFKNYLSVSAIDFEFIQNIAIITFASWVPLHLVKWLLRKYRPSEEYRIMKRARAIDIVSSNIDLKV